MFLKSIKSSSFAISGHFQNNFQCKLTFKVEKCPRVDIIFDKTYRKRLKSLLENASFDIEMICLCSSTSMFCFGRLANFPWDQWIPFNFWVKSFDAYNRLFNVNKLAFWLKISEWFPRTFSRNLIWAYRLYDTTNVWWSFLKLQWHSSNNGLRPPSCF